MSNCRKYNAINAGYVKLDEKKECIRHRKLKSINKKYKNNIVNNKGHLRNFTVAKRASEQWPVDEF